MSFSHYMGKESYIPATSPVAHDQFHTAVLTQRQEFHCNAVLHFEHVTIDFVCTFRVPEWISIGFSGQETHCPKDRNPLPFLALCPLLAISEPNCQWQEVQMQEDSDPERALWSQAENMTHYIEHCSSTCGHCKHVEIFMGFLWVQVWILQTVELTLSPDTVGRSVSGELAVIL